MSNCVWTQIDLSYCNSTGYIWYTPCQNNFFWNGSCNCYLNTLLTPVVSCCNGVAYCNQSFTAQGAGVVAGIVIGTALLCFLIVLCVMSSKPSGYPKQQQVIMVNQADSSNIPQGIVVA